MGKGWRVLFLQLQRNYITRKRHWLATILEVLAPACLFIILMGVRTRVTDPAVIVDTNTTYDALNKTSLMPNSTANLLLRILYVPQNEFTIRIMESATKCMEIPTDQLYGFETESAMLAKYDELQIENLYISVLAVVFDGTDGDSVPTNLVYTIKTSYQIDNTLLSSDAGGLGTAADALVNEIPFVPLQMCLDDSFIIEVASNYTAEQASMRVIQKMPYPPYDTTGNVGSFFGVIVSALSMIMFIVTLCTIPTYLIMDKQSGVNALLKMNGVEMYHNCLTWMISGVVMGSVTSAVIVLVLKVQFSSDQLSFYYYSSGLILWLALFVNFIHTYAFCLHSASFFTQTRNAQLAEVLIVCIVSIFVNRFKQNDDYSSFPILGFMFPTAVSFRIFEEFNDYNDQLTGVQWNNIFTSAHEGSGVSGSLGFGMILGISGTLYHSLIAVYLEAIFPSKFNILKSPIFCLKCFSNNKASTNIDAVESEDSDARPLVLERVAKGALTPGIQIRNLKKSFKSGLFKPKIVEAVGGIDLDFYKGQVTALLGLNGAGKTIMMWILTGLMAPTSGTVIVNGKNISTDMQDIWDDLGMCPQENMLFADLTVLEQLQLLALLKQRKKTRQQVIQDVDNLLIKLKINDKRNVLPHQLSDGQKRRLSLGLALVSDASTLILDEPTSGMDPETTRLIWEVILNYRKQKTIVITTDSMEEAEVLGDRIAIMDSGKMKCYGTSMFLKKFYGGNYQEVTLSIEPWCDQGKIQAIVGTEAKMDTTTYGRIVLSIPITDTLPEILDKLELLKAELGITGVSVSTVTLEEVFLKTTEEENKKEENETEEQNRISEGHLHHESEAQRNIKLTGLPLMMQVIQALLKKKFTYARINWGSTMGIILGSLMTSLLMPIFASSPSDTIINQPLDLSLYPDSEALIYAENQTIANTYKQIVESQGSTGTLIGTGASIIEALLAMALEELAYYRNNIVISAEFNSSDEFILANSLYSGSAVLSAPITVNVMSNTLLKMFGGERYSIVANIENLPEPFSDYVHDHITIQSLNLLPIVTYMNQFFIIVASFASFPLMESCSTVKQLQRMTGVSSVLYWGTMFIFDYAVYIMITIGTLIGYYASNIIPNGEKYDLTEIGILALLYLLFGIDLLLAAYISSFSKKPFHTILLLLYLVNMVLTTLQIFINFIPVLLSDHNILFVIQRRLFSFLPHISFGSGLLEFSDAVTQNARCREMRNSFHEVACFLDDPCCGLGCADGSCERAIPYFGKFSEGGSLDEYLLYLGLLPILFLVILFSLEHRVYEKLMSRLHSNESRASNDNGVVDKNVANEKNIIRQGINQYEGDPSFQDDNAFFAYELSKRYGNLLAVEEVNFRVKKNECFGLLGVNGAGKSTTFRMLVGEEFPTSGILLRGHNNIKSNRKQYLAGIGYCPQMDALIPSFNAYEHLSLIARLRGVPDSQVVSEVQLWIDRLRLNKYANNSSQSYSGGNKRRLNIAMALIANPEMVLLDEPTAGMNPRARRSLWTVLQSCQAAGQAIILTSHSMEECEALCSRLLIMVKGRLGCVGPSQQLKQRFGAGYNITVKLNPERKEVENTDIKEQIQDAFACELRDEHTRYLLYHVTDPRTTWVKMFGTMNSLKSKHSCIEDFTISSTTLEQLFIKFARSVPGSILATATFVPQAAMIEATQPITQVRSETPKILYQDHSSTLELFARLRGVPDSEVTTEVQSWIDRLRLNKHAKNSSEGYSGGTKRRLNIAMALIANPEMVLLDEPTAGVDPQARRSLWTVLQSCQAAGQAIILTSHSMEECEALCNRLLIMIEGKLVCVGATQQLKHRFGAGYDITVKLNPERMEEENANIKEKIQAAFACELRDEHPGYLSYHVTDSQTTWAKMFETMNNLKSEYSCIEDFTVSSATLEQLFIKFARSAPGSILATATSQSDGVANKASSV